MSLLTQPTINCYHIFEYLRTLSTSSFQGSLLIVGDLNLPGINRPLLSGSSPFENSFCELVYDMNLIQVVDSPLIKGNILGLIFTNDPSFVFNISVSCDLTFYISTVYLTVSFSLNNSSMQHPKFIKKHVLDYSKADWEGLCLHLLEVDFSSCYRSVNIEYVWSYIYFFKAILNSLPMFVPTFRIHSKQRPKWITPCLQHQLNSLYSLRRRMLGRQDPTVCTRLERVKQHLYEELMIAKTAYESKL